MSRLCDFGERCLGALEDDGPYDATHQVATMRVDGHGNDEVLALCTSDAKSFVGGSIEVANGPHVITVVRLT